LGCKARDVEDVDTRECASFECAADSPGAEAVAREAVLVSSSSGGPAVGPER
jgi:hypothetical protein